MSLWRFAQNHSVGPEGAVDGIRDLFSQSSARSGELVAQVEKYMLLGHGTDPDFGIIAKLHSSINRAAGDIAHHRLPMESVYDLDPRRVSPGRLLIYMNELREAPPLGRIAKNADVLEWLRTVVDHAPTADAALGVAAKAYELRLGSPPELANFVRTLPVSVSDGLRKQLDAETLAHLRGGGFFGNRVYEEHLLGSQDEMEVDFEKLLEHYVQANAPPEPFSKMNDAWGAFTHQLPSRVKPGFTLKLLNAHEGDAKSIAAIIAQLPPEPAIREAVAKFLYESPLTRSDRAGFSSAQIEQMFGGSRFRQFFPWIGEIRVRNDMQTKLSLALATNPSLPSNQSSANMAWLLEKVDNGRAAQNGTIHVLGFRPATTYDRLNRQMSLGFASEWANGWGVTQVGQMRGLIVQGSYERQSSTLMWALSGRRGSSQVENSAPALMQTMEYQLKSGWLRSLSELDKRLFVYFWSLNADGNLIQSIRNRAIRVAESDPGFWNLRVEIHNFPTWDTIRRSENYLSRFNGSATERNELEILIAEMKSLLGEASSSAQAEGLVRSLPASDADRASLIEMVGGYSNLSPMERLKRIQKIRDRWKELGNADASTLKLTDFFVGDRELSQRAMVEGSNVLQQLENGEIAMDPDAVVAAGKQMIHQVRLDDLLTAGQANHLSNALDSVTARRDLTIPQKLEAISTLINNAVDQAYYRLRSEFGAYDERLLPIVNKPDGGVPVKFVDGVLRSQNTFPLSKLSEQIDRFLLAEKRIEHEINGQTARASIEVFNPGESVGTLRFNPNPLDLTPDDIAVFEQMPVETAPVGGIITLGVGARLSHLQLLARSLKIPNAKFSKNYLSTLRNLQGKRVRYSVGPGGRVRLNELASDEALLAERDRGAVEVPTPDHQLATPVSFDRLGRAPPGNIAGPKGLNLAKMRAQPILHDAVPDGFVIPFGFFDLYARQTGLKRGWTFLPGHISKIKILSP